MSHRKSASLLPFLLGLVVLGACVPTVEETPPPRITTTSLGTAKVGVGYSQPLAATGGVAPLAWSIRSRGDGLDWLTIHGATGQLGGTPIAAGAALPLTLAVVGADGEEGTAQFQLTVVNCEAGTTGSCNQVVEGACQLGESTCEGDEVICNLTGPSTDLQWCGPSCTACDPTQADGCTGGVCTCGGQTCGEGETCCGGNCVNLLEDVENCGGCGTACDEGSAEVNPRCATGVCDYSQCSPGFGTCPPGSSDTCNTNLRTAETCGSCENSCLPAPANTELASEACPAGACVYEPIPPWADCNTSMADGCETNLHTDELNCGTCGNGCPEPVGGYPECDTGSCVQKCDTASDRICGDTCVPLNSTAHCGGCDKPCPQSAPNASSVTCNGTGCVAQCVSGWQDCKNGLADGCETDITSVDHCGTCGDTFCDGCVNGQCCRECGGALCCGQCTINSKGYEICTG